MSKNCVVPDVHGREFWKKAMDFGVDSRCCFIVDTESKTVEVME